jgi:hydroxyacylglutathione hydrolase
MIALRHPFDKKFEEDFILNGIEGFHINGHTLGFTFYIFEKVLFICDYLIPRNNRFIFNPYGPSASTIEGATKLQKIIENRDLNIVCGYKYILDYPGWKNQFELLLNGGKN